MCNTLICGAHPLFTGYALTIFHLRQNSAERPGQRGVVLRIEETKKKIIIRILIYSDFGTEVGKTS